MRFISFTPNLEVIIRPNQYVRHPQTGEVMEVAPALTARFTNFSFETQDEETQEGLLKIIEKRGKLGAPQSFTVLTEDVELPQQVQKGLAKYEKSRELVQPEAPVVSPELVQFDGVIKQTKEDTLRVAGQVETLMQAMTEVTQAVREIGVVVQNLQKEAHDEQLPVTAKTVKTKKAK